MSRVYIHIPFCDTLCSYCDFCKVINYQKFTEKYLNVLNEEINSSYNGEQISSIYIGGGTPSTLSAVQIKFLGQIINVFNISNDCEITFECNFENTTMEKLVMLKTIGVNRLSFGVQTFNDRLLKIINRSHNVGMVEKILEDARECGFNNINVDFIFNLPTQTMEELVEDLNCFLSLNVEHISIYSLILEKKTVFYHNNINIDDDLASNMYIKIKDILSENNYLHYEVSNFSKLGFESSHNLGYWNCEEYYGFGLGAHGYLNGVRYENTTSINKYLNKEFIVNEEELSIEEQMSEFVILGLRKKTGISIVEFQNRFEQDIFNVFDFSVINSELLEINEETIKTTESGMLLLNDILIHFI